MFNLKLAFFYHKLLSLSHLGITINVRKRREQCLTIVFFEALTQPFTMNEMINCFDNVSAFI